MSILEHCRLKWGPIIFKILNEGGRPGGTDLGLGGGGGGGVRAPVPPIVTPLFRGPFSAHTEHSVN